MATNHYIGIAEPGPNNWSISFPSFPGVVTTGETFGELTRNARDALATIVEAMQDDGQTLPLSVDDDEGGLGHDLSGYHEPRSIVFPVEVQGASVRANITMDSGLLAQVDELSRSQGSSRSAVLARGARMVLASERGG